MKSKIIQTKMDRHLIPLRNREVGTQEESSGEEYEACVGEMEEDSDLSVGGSRHSSDLTSCWGSLPYLCLKHVFGFLSDCDRVSATLVCHHWHRVMRSPSLWRSHFFHFSGRLSRFRQSEYCAAVCYARSLGAYLEKLEVCVCPPRRNLVAQRLEMTITGLLSELIRVNAPLRSISLIRLELDRAAWTSDLRNSLISSLTYLLRRRSSKLIYVCLNGMRNHIRNGLELLSALSYSQRHRSFWSYDLSLDLRGFFSRNVHIYPNVRVPRALNHLHSLTDLSMNYSYLSDELLVALQRRHRERRRHCDRESTLERFSLYCPVNEIHQQLVSGDSWATLASSCPNLKVKLTVDQVINPSYLARILLPEIPLTEYTMTAFYSPDESLSAKPLLGAMLPRYRCSLQYLTLDLSNCNESLDEELLELIRVCEHLEELRVWAFLEIGTVERLLQIRLKQRSLLNKIRVRIYTVEDDTEDLEDQLEEILCSHLHLPPELEFYAIIYPYVDD